MEEYDPLTYENLAKSVADQLLDRPAQEFPPSKPFDGAGVYAIYYVGPLAIYRFLTRPECCFPIYVGKAIPKGGRKGQSDVGGRPLFSRLQQHAASIRATKDLSIEHFRCRYLTVKRVWITLAEQTHSDYHWTGGRPARHDAGYGRSTAR